MAILLNEKRFINDNTLLFDEKINSPTVRFLETTPSFVTYYHININESTSDEGFKDVESLIGEKSPIKFQQIKDFPIYGIDQIVADLQDSEVGFDVNFAGEGTILPNTIKPLPNDYFILDIHPEIIFRVTDIAYDNIRHDNFYKISFKLEYIDTEKLNSLNKQVHDKYTCILENIGTEEKCIINTSLYEKIEKIDAMYNDMINLYISIFYNERYNVLLGEFGGGRLIYDPYMCKFINSNKLFSIKNSIESIYLEEDHILDKKFELKYERSIYRFFERCDLKLIKPFFYTIFNGIDRKESGFSKYKDGRIVVLDIPAVIEPSESFFILPDSTINTIRVNGPTNSKYLSLIMKYLRDDKVVTLDDISLDLNDELISLDANLEMFFITPILLFIIKNTVNKYLKEGIDINNGDNNIDNLD